MTTRQAVLASMVDSSHVSLGTLLHPSINRTRLSCHSLGEGNRSKKKILNETELALRREETARKRKNLTEKKLEDEKVSSFLIPAMHRRS